MAALQTLSAYAGQRQQISSFGVASDALFILGCAAIRPESNREEKEQFDCRLR